MFDFKQTKDYSMPFQCGAYQPPPYEYIVRDLTIPFQCKLDVKAKFIPRELEPDDRFNIITIREYPESTIGYYNEAIIILSCKYKGSDTGYIAFIYVDDDMPLLAGREIWGYPKKIAEIGLSPLENGRITGFLKRRGTMLIEADADIESETTEIDIEELNKNIGGSYSLKIIPHAHDNTKPLYRQLVLTKTKYSNYYRTRKIAKINSVTSNPSKFDLCHELLKDAVMGPDGNYIEYGFILYNGEVAE